MQTTFLTSAVKEADEMLMEGYPQHKILAHIVKAAEEIAGKDSVVSILLLDKEGLLRNGSSPQLPYDYLTAIDGIRPNKNVGTCAAAAATGEIVTTIDFKSDEKWSELRHLPLSLGFKSAWSMPIKSDKGQVLGTFGTYFRTNRHPSKEEIEAVSVLSKTVAHIITKES
jgi:GAF domain-containing protein